MPGRVGGPGQGWGGFGPTGAPCPPLTLQAHDAADDHDVTPAAPLHVGQHLLDEADEAEEVGVHEGLHGRQALALQGTRHAHPGVADCGHGASVGRPPRKGLPRPVLPGSPARDVLGVEHPWQMGGLQHRGSPAHKGSLVQDVLGMKGSWCME